MRSTIFCALVCFSSLCFARNFEGEATTPATLTCGQHKLVKGEVVQVPGSCKIELRTKAERLDKNQL